MARPKPTILLERSMDNTHLMQVLAAEKLWTVTYQDQPVNLRKVVLTINGDTNKYMRNAFTSEAPAKNLAEKLNRWFFTKDFGYKRVM